MASATQHCLTSSFGDRVLLTHRGDEGRGDVSQGGVCRDEERFDSGQFVVHAGHRHFVVQVGNAADSADDDVDSDSAAVVDQQAARVGVDRDVAQVSRCRTEPVQPFRDRGAAGLVRIEHHAHDNLVEQEGSAPEYVLVSLSDRVEGSWEEGSHDRRK